MGEEGTWFLSAIMCLRGGEGMEGDGKVPGTCRPPCALVADNKLLRKRYPLQILCHLYHCTFVPCHRSYNQLKDRRLNLTRNDLQ